MIFTESVALMTDGYMITTLTSNPFRLQSIDGAAIQCVMTGSPTGTLTLEASCDKGLDTGSTIANINNWSTVANSSQAISASGTHMWNVDGANYKYIRVKYTFSSGTGYLTINVTGKG